MARQAREVGKIKEILIILHASPTCPAEVLTKAEASAKAGKSGLKK
jgi:hypothetical protein